MQTQLGVESLPPDVGVRRVRARRLFAARAWATGIALWSVSVVGCGDGSDSGAATPANPPPSSSSSPTAPSNPGAPEPPMAAESPAADPGSARPAGESPMSGVPLEPPSMDEGEGASADGESEPPSAGPMDPPPDDDPEPETVPPETVPPDMTPPEPAAFAPCPSDGSPCRVMPLGDSITFGIGARTPLFDQGGYRMELFRLARADGHAITFVGRQANGPMSVANETFPTGHEGYPGATINDGNNQLANRVDAAIAAANPDIVLLMIGTNDVNGNVNNPPDDLRNLIDQITNGAPDALLVVAQIVPTRTPGTNMRVQAYNATVDALVRESAAAGKHVALVDMFSAFTQNPNFANALLIDNLHPNDAGFVVMAETWYPAIEGLLP